MFTNIYSPLQHLRHPVLRQLWIKRDDLTDPFISGNKWRKLKYILKDAVSSGKSHLVTFGGAYSNHLVATAAAAARASFQSTAFIRGEMVNNEILLLCKLYGMQLIFTDRDSYRDKTGLFERYFKNDPDALFIDEGGAGVLGVKGCEEIIHELPENTEHIFCAAGTGTTAAGLLSGLIKSNNKASLHVIPVLKEKNYISEQILHLLAMTEKTAINNLEDKEQNYKDRLNIHQDYHFGGYAKVSDALLIFMKEFIHSTGIMVDPVYTAKLFYAIDDLSKKGKIDKDSKIVALHTGGLLGIFGFSRHLQ